MPEQVRSADLMVQMFKDDPILASRLKTDADPLAVLKTTAETAISRSEPAYLGDQVLYRIAVGVLGALALLAALGSIGLTAVGEATPDVLIALGSAAVGALVGLFAPSPSK